MSRDEMKRSTLLPGFPIDSLKWTKTAGASAARGHAASWRPKPWGPMHESVEAAPFPLDHRRGERWRCVLGRCLIGSIPLGRTQKRRSVLCERLLECLHPRAIGVRDGY